MTDQAMKYVYKKGDQPAQPMMVRHRVSLEIPREISM
jgi:hypothetical protein